MEIKFTPVSHEALLRSLRPIDTAPQFLTAPSLSNVSSASLSGPTPSMSSNPINWGNVVLGTIAVAAFFYLIDYYIQEKNRKD